MALLAYRGAGPLLLAALVGMSPVLASCKGQLTKGQPASDWTYTEAKDPITLENSASAKASLATDDPSLTADVEFNCGHTTDPAQRPLGLKMTLTTYDQGAKKGANIPGATLDVPSIQYRIDAIGNAQAPQQNQADYTNRYTVNFALVRAGLNAGGPSTAAVTLLAQMADLLDGENAKAMSDNVMATLRTGTQNFKWNFQTLTLKFRAATSTGSSEQTLLIPLNDPSIVKVATACGWSQNPPPLPTEPAAPAPVGDAVPVDAAQVASDEAQAEAESRADIAEQEKAEAAAKPPYPVATNPRGKPATCRVELVGKLEYQGPCTFAPRGGGSFDITKTNGEIIQNINAIVVDIRSPDQAFLYLNHSSGAGHDDVGDLIRAPYDRSCWVGLPGTESAGAKVCVK